MQLAPLAPIAPLSNATTKPSIDDAVLLLDWAHETAGAAVSDPSSMDFDTLFGASKDALDAAELLDGLKLPDGARHARDAANAFDSAAVARLHEDHDVADSVIQGRGEDAEAAIHEAFTAIGFDGRGE